MGCGYAARTRHLPGLARIPEAEVVGVTDIDVAAAEEVGREWGVPHRRGLEELLSDPAVEAVAVCVPATHHVEVALAALGAGRHVVIEKPLTLSLEEADRLIERAEGPGPKVMVAFNMRWHRHVRRARGLLEQGALGRVHFVRTVHGGQAIAMRNGQVDWRTTRATGGGALLEKAVHHFDLWRYLLGDEVEDVFAVSSSGAGEDETVSIDARMRGGALVSGIAADSTVSVNRVELYGERGALELCLYRFDGFAHSSLEDLPGAPRTRLKRLFEALSRPWSSLAAVRTGGIYDSSYQEEWRHFAHAVRADERPECGLEDGRRALAIALAAAHSASTGVRVRVADAPAEVSPFARV